MLGTHGKFPFGKCIPCRVATRGSHIDYQRYGSASDNIITSSGSTAFKYTLRVIRGAVWQKTYDYGRSGSRRDYPHYTRVHGGNRVTDSFRTHSTTATTSTATTPEQHTDAQTRTHEYKSFVFYVNTWVRELPLPPSILHFAGRPTRSCLLLRQLSLPTGWTYTCTVW